MKITINMRADKEIYQLITPKSEKTIPLLFESPHSGTYHPIEGDENIDAGHIYPGVDRYVDQLFDFTPEIGATQINAQFCRCYIDTNRALDDMKPEWIDGPWPYALAPSAKSHNGIGLIWPNKDKQTYSVSEIEERIETYYRPYHSALHKTLQQLREQHGYALHISCHSAPRPLMKPKRNRRPNYTADIVISDLNGQSADARYGRILREALEKQGYKVLSNDPFEGDELIRAHSAPHNHIHSLQIEINRAIYMSEKTNKLNQAKFLHLKTNLLKAVIPLIKHNH